MNPMPQATALYIPPSDFIPKSSKRKDWFSPRIAPRKAAEEKPALRVSTATMKPVERVWTIQHDSHVAAFYEWKGNPPIGFLKLRCREIGVDYATMVGPSQFRKDVEPRHRLIADLKRKFPDITTPQLGRIFGGRDHSTIIKALRKEGIEVCNPDIARRTINDVADQVYELLKQGVIHARIAEIVGFSQTGVWSLVHRRGWQNVSTYRRPVIADHIETLRQMFDDGASFAEMGRRIGYTATNISRLIKREGWSR